MALMNPTQTEQVRQWAIANNLNPNIQIQEAERLLANRTYATFDEMANAAQIKRAAEVSEQARQPTAAATGNVSDDQIRAWFRENQNASEAEISAALGQYGVSPQQVAQAMGNTRLPNAPASIQLAQYQNITGGRTDINDINRAIVARNLGVSAEELASTGMNLAQAQALVGRASEQNPVAGQVSTDQIKAWLATNPNASDQQMFQMMQAYGVTPLQVSQATGIDVNEIMRRQQGAAQDAAELIPTGLSGYEQSIRGGLADATGTLRGAETASRADIESALENINRLYGVNIDDLRAAATQASGQINAGFDEARGYYQPFQQGGEQAFQQQLALSGALGQDAFNAARQESPYEKFLFEQGMRGNLAGAAATGGLGGGNVQKELQRFGQGLASQGLQQQIGNLNTLSGMGMQGAQGLSGLATGRAGALGDITLNTAQNIGAQRGQQAQYAGQAGVALANLGQNTGTNIANLQYGTGESIAGQRARAGELLAGQIGQVMPIYSSLLENMGLNQSNLIGTQTGNVQNLQQQAANQAVIDRINLAGGMADLSTGLATSQANALGGQPFTQPPPFSYSQAAQGALGAAGTGYDLAKMYQAQNQGYSVRPTQLPAGYGSPQIGPMPSNYNPALPNISGVPTVANANTGYNFGYRFS